MPPCSNSEDPCWRSLDTTQAALLYSTLFAKCLEKSELSLRFDTINKTEFRWNLIKWLDHIYWYRQTEQKIEQNVPYFISTYDQTKGQTNAMIEKL